MDLGGETVSAYRPLPSDDQVFGRADIFRVGDFLLQFATWSGAPALGATHASEPDRVLWASVAGQGFLAGVAVTSVAEAAATGHPVMRHLVLHYPEDRRSSVSATNPSSARTCSSPPSSIRVPPQQCFCTCPLVTGGTCGQTPPATSRPATGSTSPLPSGNRQSSLEPDHRSRHRYDKSQRCRHHRHLILERQLGVLADGHSAAPVESRCNRSRQMTERSQ